MPGRLRGRADDAGRPSFRGGPHAGTDRCHPRAPSARAVTAWCRAEEGRGRRARQRGKGSIRGRRCAAAREEGADLMGIKPVLTKDFATENLQQLSVYERTGGDAAVKKALEMEPGEVAEVWKKSGVRGPGRAAGAT